MSDMMPTPDNWKDFVKEYSFKDKEEIYTNGSELIPVFRVEQMKEHYFVEKQVAEYWYQGYYKLLGELANYKWISVKDRMPEKNMPVMTYDERGFMCIDMWKGNMWAIAWSPDEYTHWMPLPEPPKEDAEC